MTQQLRSLSAHHVSACPHDSCTVWNYRTSCSVSFWPNLRGSVRSITVQILRGRPTRPTYPPGFEPGRTGSQGRCGMAPGARRVNLPRFCPFSSAVRRPDGSIIRRVGGAGFEPASSEPRNSCSTNWATPPANRENITHPEKWRDTQTFIPSAFCKICCKTGICCTQDCWSSQ